MDSLRHDFGAARLPLELRSVPLSFNAEDARDVVQMDIARDAPKKRLAPERFRIYRGHSANQLRIVDADAGLRQLVLSVKETERSFVSRVRATDLREGDNVVQRIGDTFFVEHRTTRAERTFLLGMDEAHLFIALLPEHARSVAAAHACLEPATVTEAKGRGAHVVRQGEWFFIALDAIEHAWVDHLAKKSLPVSRRNGIAEAVGLRRLGRPHVAEEVLVVRGFPDPRGDASERWYVRGTVVHPDHRTLVLDMWRRVVPNREELELPVPGVDWID